MEFIHAHRKEWPITVMCDTLEVNRSYYYDYIKQLQDNLSGSVPEVEKQLINLFHKHKGNYGSRRLMKGLNELGFTIGRYKVRSLMKKHGLIVKKKHRFKVTTDSQHTDPVAENILNREFDVTEPDKVWTTDITFVWTNEGWLYLAIVMDLFSRQIIGWSIQDHMRTSLCLDALKMAWMRRKRPAGVLHHSDRGSQYASGEYREQLTAYSMVQSMSRKGNCWDNSPTERAFRTLKSEWLNRFNFQTKTDAIREVWSYISYYNRDRAHSTLNYQTPMAYEEQYFLQKVA